MIKVTLKGIAGTIIKHYFKTWVEAYKWLDSVIYDENGTIGYSIEGRKNEIYNFKTRYYNCYYCRI